MHDSKSILFISILMNRGNRNWGDLLIDSYREDIIVIGFDWRLKIYQVEIVISLRFKNIFRIKNCPHDLLNSKRKILVKYCRSFSRFHSFFIYCSLYRETAIGSFRCKIAFATFKCVCPSFYDLLHEIAWIADFQSMTFLTPIITAVEFRVLFYSVPHVFTACHFAACSIIIGRFTRHQNFCSFSFDFLVVLLFIILQ